MSLAGRTFLFNSDMAFSASAEEYSEFGSPIGARTFLVADGTAYSMIQISNSGSEGVNEIVYTSGSVDTTVTAYNVDYQNPPYTYWTDDKYKAITFIIEPLPLRGKFTTSADIEQWVVDHSIEITTITSWSYEENGVYYRLRGLTLQDQQDIWSIRNKIDGSRIDAANGVAGLDTNGKVRSAQLPSEATTSASGFMSATDKTKLDGIATGATNVEIVDNLTTNDSSKALSAAQGYALNNKIPIIATVTGTMSSSLNTEVTVAMPTGFNAENSVVLGYTTKHTNAQWYSNIPEINVFLNAANVRIKTSDSSYLSQPFKVVVMKCP